MWEVREVVVGVVVFLCNFYFEIDRNDPVEREKLTSLEKERLLELFF